MTHQSSFPSAQIYSFPGSTGARHALVVDPGDDTREVLCTLLSRRGWCVRALGGYAAGAREADRRPTDLVVLDVEQAAELGGPSAAQFWADRFARAVGFRGGRVIVLGEPGRAASVRQTLVRMLAKPYRYADLLRTIEEMDARRAAA